MRRLQPLLWLSFLSPFIGEVVSSNVPLSLFASRPLMILFALLTYSLPVLLLRELFVASKLSYVGGAIAGFAYGIFNEGLLARTLLMSEGLPVPTFDHYLVAGGINFSWAITILVWHSIFSVGTPILLVHWLYPEVKQDSWLSKRWTILALLITTSTSCLFFREGGGTPGYYAIFVVAITGLLAVANGFKASTQSAGHFSWLPLLVGISSFAYFGGSFLISGLQLPPVLFLLYWLAFFVAGMSYLQRLSVVESGPLLFCIGNCIAYSVFVFVAKMHKSMEGTAVALMIFFSYFLFLVAARRRRFSGQRG